MNMTITIINDSQPTQRGSTREPMWTMEQGQLDWQLEKQLQGQPEGQPEGQLERNDMNDSPNDSEKITKEPARAMER